MAGIEEEKKRLSTMAGYVVDSDALPHPGYGHVFVGGPAPVLAYQIAPHEARVMVDIPDGEHGIDAPKKDPAYLEALSPTIREAVRKALLGLAGPKYETVVHGQAEVRQIFKIGRNYAAAGCLVLEGSVLRTDRCRVLRGGREVFDGKIATLRRFKDDVREVQAGTECGIGLEGYGGFEVGDILESYAQEEVSRSA